MATVGDEIGAVHPRLAFLAREFQQSLVAREMAALRQIEAAIMRLFAKFRDGGRGLARGGGKILKPHMGQFRVRSQAEFADDGGEARRAVMGFENGRLRAFFEHDQNAQMPSIGALRLDIAPVEAQMQRRRQNDVLRHMQDEALLHQGGVQIDDRMVLLRIDLANIVGDGRILLAEDFA